MSLPLPEPPKTKSLVAVSGGRDSVALLDMLHRAGARKLVVAHLDHRLRARASAADARFVARLAAGYGYRSHLGREDVAARAARDSVSLETAGRHARHAFFAQVARAERTSTVYLAHHADDQAETILHNLCRGSSASGLCGMAPETALKVGRRTLVLRRPLLGVLRKDIDAYIREHGLAFREDASNTDRSLTRNRIRHDLLAAAAAASGRDPAPAILRAFAHLSDDSALLDSLAAEASEEAARPGNRLSAPAIARLPPALARRVLWSWLRRSGVQEVGKTLVDRILRVSDPKSGTVAAVNLPGGRRVRRKARELFIDTP